MHTDIDVLVVGTGFSGLGMAIRLKKAGMDNFVVLEQSDAIGGTWRDNHYPGVACDVPSHLYSFSFEPNPHWSRMFAEQKEILAYLNGCADKYRVRPHIHFRSEVVKAVFDERRGQWDVTVKGGRTYRTRALVTGGAALSKPSLPQIPGIGTFKGKTFHTARWDHDYSLAGKRVAVIGTGASSIQVVPSIVDKVGSLTLFQRTPAWVLPKPDFRFSAKQQERFEKFPWVQRAFRSGIYSFLESGTGGFSGMMPSLLARTETQARSYLAAQVKDPVLRSKLTPNFRLGCKRLLLSNTYYSALQRPHASVVTSGIVEVREHSIVTQDGQEHELDAIVFATGFASDGLGAPYEIRGRNGVEMNSTWVECGGPEAYYGSTVAGFPNFFMMLGPNTGLGNNSMVFMIESQLQYIMSALLQMRERALAWVDVKPATQRSYNKQLTARLSRTVWATGGCSSWYTTKTGKNIMLWPGFTSEFRMRTRKFDLHDYEVRAQSELRSEPPVRASATQLEQPAE